MSTIWSAICRKHSTRCWRAADKSEATLPLSLARFFARPGSFQGPHLLIVSARLGAVAATGHGAPAPALAGTAIEKKPAAPFALAHSNMGEILRAQKCGNRSNNATDRFGEFGAVLRRLAAKVQTVARQLQRRRATANTLVESAKCAFRRTAAIGPCQKEIRRGGSRRDRSAKVLLRRPGTGASESAKRCRVTRRKHAALFAPVDQAAVVRERFGHLPIAVDRVDEIQRQMAAYAPQRICFAAGVTWIRLSRTRHGTATTSSNPKSGYHTHLEWYDSVVFGQVEESPSA